RTEGRGKATAGQGRIGPEPRQDRAGREPKRYRGNTETTPKPKGYQNRTATETTPKGHRRRRNTETEGKPKPEGGKPARGAVKWNDALGGHSIQGPASLEKIFTEIW